MPSNTSFLCTVTWGITRKIYRDRKRGATSGPRSRSPDVRLGSGAAGRGFEPTRAWCFRTSFLVTPVGDSWGLPSTPQPRFPADTPELVLLPGSEDARRPSPAGAAVHSERCVRQLSVLALALRSIPSPFAERLSAFLLLL